MSHLFNNGHKYTQKDIAALLGISSDRHVRRLIEGGILPPAKPSIGYDPHACILAYIRYRAAPVDILAEAKAGNIEGMVEQKEREQQLKNDALEERIKLSRIKRLVLEKQYAPIDVITDTISQVAISMRTRVDSWLPKLKMVWPEMPPDAQDLLKRELAGALNELSEVEPNLSDYEDSDVESGFASVDTIESDGANDRSGMG